MKPKNRKRGQLQAEVADLLRSNPNITPKEVAATLRISSSNAGMALRRAKRVKVRVVRPSFAQAGSARDRAIGGSAASPHAQRLVALATLVGFDAALGLISAERDRVLKTAGAA